MGKSSLSRLLLTQIRRKLVLDTLGDDYDRGCIVESAELLRRYYNRVRTFEDFTAILRPKSDADIDGFFHVARHAWNCWIIVDEVDRYCNATHAHPDLYWIINYGRHRLLNVVGIARRPAEVARTLTANADWRVALQVTEERDLKYLANYMDVSRLPSLDEHEWQFSGRSAVLTRHEFGGESIERGQYADA